jgi:hypothetical protein
LDAILGPIDLKNLQLAFDKLGWSPPDFPAIVAALRGDARFRGKALDVTASVRQKWIEDLWRSEQLDRKEQAATYSSLRADIGEWLDHFTRGDDRPK